MAHEGSNQPLHLRYAQNDFVSELPYSGATRPDENSNGKMTWLATNAEFGTFSTSVAKMAMAGPLIMWGASE